MRSFKPKLLTLKLYSHRAKAKTTKGCKCFILSYSHQAEVNVTMEHIFQAKPLSLGVKGSFIPSESERESQVTNKYVLRDLNVEW